MDADLRKDNLELRAGIKDVACKVLGVGCEDKVNFAVACSRLSVHGGYVGYAVDGGGVLIWAERVVGVAVNGRRSAVNVCGGGLFDVHVVCSQFRLGLVGGAP